MDTSYCVTGSITLPQPHPNASWKASWKASWNARSYRYMGYTDRYRYRYTMYRYTMCHTGCYWHYICRESWYATNTLPTS